MLRSQHVIMMKLLFKSFLVLALLSSNNIQAEEACRVSQDGTFRELLAGTTLPIDGSCETAWERAGNVWVSEPIATEMFPQRPTAWLELKLYKPLNVCIEGHEIWDTIEDWCTNTPKPDPNTPPQLEGCEAVDAGVGTPADVKICETAKLAALPAVYSLLLD